MHSLLADCHEQTEINRLKTNESNAITNYLLAFRFTPPAILTHKTRVDEMPTVSRSRERTRLLSLYING